MANRPEIGLKLFNEKKFIEAVKTFREAIKIDPYNATYRHNLDSVLNSQGKLDEAEKEIELSMRLAPNEESYKRSLEIICANK